MPSTVVPYQPDHHVRSMAEADDDQQLIALWLHGKSENTRLAYLRDIEQFIEYVDLPLRELVLGHLQSWSDELAKRGMADTTRARKLASVKSLYTFGHKIGYLAYNVGAAIQTPKTPDDLAERILPKDAIQRILAAANNLRDSVLLLLFYASGGRVSELSGLRWKSSQPRTLPSAPDAGQITLHGKGNKTRHILLSPATWSSLMQLRAEEKKTGFGAASDPVFRSRKGGNLTRQQMWLIVKNAARRAGLEKAVSPHWLRHAHASHALDEGAPVHLVKETLGHKSLATTSRYTHARPGDSSANYLGV